MELQVNSGDRELVMDELAAAQAAGFVWTAFNNPPESAINRYALYFFRTQREAEDFCDQNNTAFINPYEDGNGWESYAYVPVSQMQLYVMGIPETYLGLDISVSEIAALMTDQKLHLLPGKSYAEALDSFQNGRIFPALWKEKTDPLPAIAEYHIVQHRHNGGLVYETGHSHRVAGSYETYQGAKTAMGLMLARSVLEKDGCNYLLADRYHGQKLELDMEGCPSLHTGLLLETAYWQYDTELRSKAYQQQELNSLHDPAEIQKYFFAGFDRASQTVQVLNDRLQAVDPVTAMPVSPPWHYQYNLLTTKNQKIMNQESFEFTKDQLLNLGFGDEIAGPLHTAMDKNLAEFTLNHSREFGKDKVESVLHFSKGDDAEKDLTFFNRFDATLKKEGMEDLTQTFFVGKKYNYTLQERYNMMDGRSAYREQPKMEPKEENGKIKMVPTGETYLAWRGLNFKEADKYGNFNPKVVFWNHEAELQKYPIKGIEEKYDRSRIMRPLEKGNKANVVLLRDGVEIPAQVVANPRMMRLDFYDANGQSLIVRKVQKQAVDETQKVAQTPQEVQRGAIARAAQNQEQNGAAGQAPPQDHQAENNGQAQNRQTVNKEQVAEEQTNKQATRRRKGVHV